MGSGVLAACTGRLSALHALPTSARRRGRSAVAALALLAVLAAAAWVATGTAIGEPAKGTALGVVTPRSSTPARAPSVPATIALCALVVVVLWTRVAAVSAPVRSVVRRTGQGRDPPA
jgi:hypothetical protein